MREAIGYFGIYVISLREDTRVDPLHQRKTVLLSSSPHTKSEVVAEEPTAHKTSRAMNCTLLIHSRKLAAKGEQPPTQDELCKMMENKDDNIKIEGAKKSILMLLNGEKLPRLPMTVIRFCINTKDKMLKKLIMLYWEVVEKFDSQGKLKPEMILVW